MPIKHIFFDLDHTLWDFEKNSAKAYHACFIKYNIGIDLNVFLEAYSPINKKYWKLYREDKVTKNDLKYGRLKEAFDLVNHSISKETILNIADEYLDYLPQFNSLFEGSVEILDYLKPKYKLHIITNGFSEIQHTKLKTSRIYDYFTQIITSESVGVKKPNPKVFRFALKKANAIARESFMVGDNLEADIIGSENVGMQAILFNPDKARSPIRHKNEISHLNEIKKYL